MKDFASPVSRRYTRIGDTSSIFLLRARRSGSNAAGDESWYPRDESR